MSKSRIWKIGEKNRIIDNIVDAMTSRHHFLLLGHKNPDDDCIAAMISCALILHMFYKNAIILIGGQIHERFRYLLDICRYNSIRILDADSRPPQAVDTVVVVDTPKPSMIEAGRGAALLDNPEILRIELDHHLGADSEYIGDKGYRLVTEASSTCELVGHLLLKLRNKKALLERHQITELFPRNLVLTILTGIVGDSNMGQFLKSRREKRYYEIFSGMFNQLLSQRTTKSTNFYSKEDVYKELQSLSAEESACFTDMMAEKRVSASIGYVALSEAKSATLFASYGDDTVVSTARIVADRLAEDSGLLGLVAYFDSAAKGGLVQFRIRRSGQYKKLDLRTLLALFSLSNGGGHEGAIGFRMPPAEVGDFEAFVTRIVEGTETAIKQA